MEIELREISIKEISEGYSNDEEEGVLGYNGKLNIRPKYQREFVYKDKQRDAVIETLRKDFPLNVMYWVKSENDTYEVMDGQQRTISLCEYIAGKFSLNFQYFHNLEEDEKLKVQQKELTDEISSYFLEQAIIDYTGLKKYEMAYNLIKISICNENPQNIIC